MLDRVVSNAHFAYYLDNIYIKKMVVWRKDRHICYFFVMFLHDFLYPMIVLTQSVVWPCINDWMFLKFLSIMNWIEMCFCFVCLCLVYPMLPVSLDSPFLIAPSEFSNVYVPQWFTILSYNIDFLANKIFIYIYKIRDIHTTFIIYIHICTTQTPLKPEVNSVCMLL
jgi:hypothetical protein